MGVVVSLAGVRQPSEEERWRAVGYQAIDNMVKKLSGEIEGKDFEELSELLRREGQAVTGALLEARCGGVERSQRLSDIFGGTGPHRANNELASNCYRGGSG